MYQQDTCGNGIDKRTQREQAVRGIGGVFSKTEDELHTSIGVIYRFNFHERTEKSITNILFRGTSGKMSFKRSYFSLPFVYYRFTDGRYKIHF